MDKQAKATTQQAGHPPVWSLIVTAFGDVAAPRGGELPTAVVIAMMELLGITPQAVRTALSRLAADGWLESRREGRTSCHAMTARAKAETETASRRIYAPPPETWDGQLGIAIIPADAEEGAARAAFAALGFGQIAPRTFVRACGVRPGGMPAGAMFVASETMGRGDAAAGLIAAAFPLAEAAARRKRFALQLAALAPDAAGPAPAMATRLRLVHEYRRLVLRDPPVPLPLRLDAEAWRHLYADMAQAYQRLLPHSEAWLESQGLSPERYVTRFDRIPSFA